MAIYTDQKFTSAVDKVRLCGVRVQEAKAQAEATKNIGPWLDALHELVDARQHLDNIILAGVDLGHPSVPPEPVAADANGPIVPSGEAGGAEQSESTDDTSDDNVEADGAVSPRALSGALDGGGPA